MWMCGLWLKAQNCQNFATVTKQNTKARVWDPCMISPENLTRVRKCKTSFLADIWNLQSKSSPEILISPLSRAPEPCAVLKLRRWQKTENLALLHHQLAHSEVERQWPERNERDERVPKQGKEKKQMQRSVSAYGSISKGSELVMPCRDTSYTFVADSSDSTEVSTSLVQWLARSDEPFVTV